jgi:diguanylate cyclase (GGDEF)-like protein
VTRVASFAVPALLLSIGALLTAGQTLPDWLAHALHTAPLPVFVGGALLGLLWERGPLVLGVIVVALADLALAYFGDRAALDAVGLLLPLNLGVLAWLGQVRLLTARGASWLAVMMFQAGVVAMLQHPELAAVATALERPPLGTWTALPPLAVVTFAVALGLVLARFLVSGRLLAAGPAWALLASFLALEGAAAGRPARIHLVIAGLLLVADAALAPRRVAYLDAVTRLPGRLALNEALSRLPRLYALARVDIDDFRRFREEYGGDAARRILRHVAAKLTQVNGGGEAFYCEGHAFAVVFRYSSAATAARHLDVVRRAVEVATLDVRVPERPRAGQSGRASAVEWTVAVTISIGLAQPERNGAGPHEVLIAAERALDSAKEVGLNRVAKPSA